MRLSPYPTQRYNPENSNPKHKKSTRAAGTIHALNAPSPKLTNAQTRKIVFTLIRIDSFSEFDVQLDSILHPISI
jgi:hypothetical protein